MEDQEKLELEVRRVLASEVEGYRNHLQSQFRILTWGIGIILTIGALLLYFFLGNTFKDSKEQLIRNIDSKMIDYRIVENFKKRLEGVIEVTLDNENSKKIIDSKVDKSAKEAIDRKILEVERIIREGLPQEIIGKISLPHGAVIAFNRDTCPSGWREYTPAYGRFIRGIDRSGDNIDPHPRGERKPGSIQEDDLGSHFHSRPNDVHSGYQDGRAWIASAKHFSYANGNPFTGETGGRETRPVNVALLYCEKN